MLHLKNARLRLTSEYPNGKVPGSIELGYSIKNISEIRKVKITYRIEDITEPFEADHSSPLVRAFAFNIGCLQNSAIVA